MTVCKHLFVREVSSLIYLCCSQTGAFYLVVADYYLTYPSPKPTLTLSSHLGRNVGLGDG